MRKLNPLLRGLSFTSLFLVSSLFLLDIALRIKYRGNTGPTAYKRYVKPYTYVKENYIKAGMNEKDIKQLLAQTWVTNGWSYESVIGFKETPRKNKYVNISTLGFRRNSKNLPSDEEFINQDLDIKNESIYFFGGSSGFGYGVKDSHTVPANIEKLSKNYKVFNFGRGYYYSEQENLLLDQLLKYGSPKPDKAIFLDGMNERCEIGSYQSQMKQMFAALATNKWDWSPVEYAKPIVKIANVIKVKQRGRNIVGVKIFTPTCKTNLTNNTLNLSDVFKSNLKMRDQICTEHKITCYTFIQPLPGRKNIHKHNQFSQEYMNEKHKVLLQASSSIKHKVIDVSEALINIKSHAWIDNVHYSPEATEAIAKEIVKQLK